MILNTLDNLGKFEPKGDEGYFLGYSMSSKAFRVFSKRTKRVEENVHIEFLENKAIEKGYGPNWLFDIDSLTKSMNYVPVVDAGINSTNFSGTKVDARKDVKKDVSSLRYIVLPNWVHEEHLESISNEEVYVMQPPRFQDPDFPAKVYKVEKAMHGLHQAPRAWYGTLSKYLLKNGFQRGLQILLWTRRILEERKELGKM
nr:ribonuclease H-like domain-containing protein [Tanacetum cinerariifolium]